MIFCVSMLVMAATLWILGVVFGLAREVEIQRKAQPMEIIPPCDEDEAEPEIYLPKPSRREEAFPA